MIKTYKKTATIDAIQWDGSEEVTDQIIDWALSHKVTILIDWEAGRITKLVIPTLEGDLTASVGDFIATGGHSDFWAIKPDIMEKTYEEV